MPGEEGIYWAKKLVKHSAPSFTSPLTYQGFKDMPVLYLLCTKDLTIPPDYQQAGIDMMESITGRKVAVTHIIAGHVAPLSHPQKVAEWVMEVANRLGTAYQCAPEAK